MVLVLEGISLITIVQSILLIISALLIIIAAIGLLRIDKDMPNVVYARIHILGLVDVAGIIAFLALGQPLFALIYLFLSPLLAHALANAYYHGEDDYNNPEINPDLLIEDPYNLNASEDVEEDNSEDVSEEVSGDSGSEDVSEDLEDVNNETAENDEENLDDSEGDDND